MASYYDILGVPKNASSKEIRQAFRRLARKHHPDLNPGENRAEANFKKINEAYEVLSDSQNRRKYDQYGANWKNPSSFNGRYGQGTSPTFEWSSHRGTNTGFGPFENLNDLFTGSANQFGHKKHTSSKYKLKTQATITLEESFTGTTRQISVHSEGKEKHIEVLIPPGVDTGSIVSISINNRNDVALTVTVAPHSQFQRKGAGLYMETKIPLEDIILGTNIEIQTLNGRVNLKVPPESQNGQRIRLSGQGMPKLGAPQDKGDLYVILRPTLPENITDEEKDLVKKFKELRNKRR